MPDYRRRAVRESMTIRLDVNGMMSEALGESGIRREEIDALAPRMAETARLLEMRREAGELPFFDLLAKTDFVQEIVAAAGELREAVDTLVVVGTGTSAFAPRALTEALGDGKVRLVVADSIDPTTFGRLLDGLDLSRTAFNVISRSGDTAETMAQFLVVRDRMLRALGAIDYKQRVVITTDGEQGSLRQIVNDEGFHDFSVPAGVRGGFSILSPVGLFPSAVAGVRVEEVLAGAGWMDGRTRGAGAWDNPALLFAALLYLAEKQRRKNVLVLLPCSDRLGALNVWIAELWSEAVAKAVDLDGKPAHVGQTPRPTLGVGDQYSQLQLYLDGPDDKVVVFFRVDDHGREIEVPAAYSDLEGVSYLGGTGLGALLNLEQRTAEFALQRRGRMAMTLAMPQLNAFTVGQLVHLSEAAALYAASLHRVDPFRQPAMDETRRLAYGQLGRKGWEDRQAEVEQWLGAKRAEYVL